MANNTVTMKALLEAGVHFGHRTRRWNPKMKPFIFTERNGIHIIDLQQTITRLNQAFELVQDTVASGGTVLFVGTKRQAQESIEQEASRCGMPYVKQRWLGGTLTNWRTIRQRIEYMLDLEKKQARGEFARLVKKEALMREREIARLNHRLGGLKEMRRLPNIVFIVDVRRDDLAVKEANILGIPIVAMVDTNCDPDPIDNIIPSNDDAIRAIKLMVSTMADAVIEGRAILESIQAEEEEAEAVEGEEAMERYLGPSTLAKIQAAEEEEARAAEEAEVEAEVEEEAVEEEVAEPVAEQPDAEAEPAEAAEEVEEVAEQPEAEVEEETAEEVEEAAEAATAEAETPEAEAEEETPEETEEDEEVAEPVAEAEDAEEKDEASEETEEAEPVEASAEEEEAEETDETTEPVAEAEKS